MSVVKSPIVVMLLAITLLVLALPTESMAAFRVSRSVAKGAVVGAKAVVKGTLAGVKFFVRHV